MGSPRGRGEGSSLAASAWDLRPGLTQSFLLRAPDILSTGRRGLLKGFPATVTGPKGA